MAKKQINAGIIFPISYLTLGILFLILRSTALDWLFTIIGVMLIIRGILSLTGIIFIRSRGYRQIIDIIYITSGLLLILGGWLFVNIILVVFGVLLIIYSIYTLKFAILNKSIHQLIQVVLTFVIGILFIVSTAEMLDIIFIIIGVIFMVKGIIGLARQA